MPGSSLRTLLRWSLGLLVVAAAGTAYVKHKDEDNRFCVSCHLHQRHMDGMVAKPPATLAAAHHGARGPGHPERCFTCHSGEGVVGWSQVTLLSAWDAVRWVLGDRNEPATMRLPLANDACLKCHAGDLGKLPRDTQTFHGIPDHRHVRSQCVDCHRTHRQGPRDRHFLDDGVVRGQCQRCHRDLEEL
jgi:hypothetical protein